MNRIIIYSSKKGSALKYATLISEELNLVMKDIKEISNELDKYDEVIYVASIYAGMINDIGELIKKTSANQKVCLIMIGFTNSKDTEYYLSTFKNNVSEDRQNNYKFFSLQGDLLFSKMNFLEKQIMKMMKSKAKKIAIEDRTQDDIDLVENFGKDIHRVSKDNISEVLEYLK